MPGKMVHFITSVYLFFATNYYFSAGKILEDVSEFSSTSTRSSLETNECLLSNGDSKNDNSGPNININKKQTEISEKQYKHSNKSSLSTCNEEQCKLLECGKTDGVSCVPGINGTDEVDRVSFSLKIFT